MVAPKDGGPQEHMNRSISGKTVFVDVVKDLEVRSSWVRVALNPIDKVLIRDKRGETDTEKPREDGGSDGRDAAASLGTPGTPRLEKAGRTLSWSLWRDFSPTTP